MMTPTETFIILWTAVQYNPNQSHHFQPGQQFQLYVVAIVENFRQTVYTLIYLQTQVYTRIFFYIIERKCEK